MKSYSLAEIDEYSYKTDDVDGFGVSVKLRSLDCFEPHRMREASQNPSMMMINERRVRRVKKSK